ncbi:MAG: phage antirepressor protein [Candidatus Aenigmarchaeota archaeon]|nr:phage antirepressor protein [Candidatus Aenigmarchaeota archaeon]
MTSKNELIVQFEDKQVRRAEHKGQWYFSITDIIAVLTESTQPKRYWSELKKKLTKEESFSQLFEKIEQLKLLAKDGKKRLTETTDVETLFRIIQSIPSKKAEPVKQWLAKVGYERLQEMENPELAMQRMREIYEQKGYPQDWIALRERSIAVRNTLTDEWKDRGADNKDYPLLTSIIGKETFGITPKKHKEKKGLNKEPLRDHMSDLELILTMLGEATSTKLHNDRESEGLSKLKTDASDAGKIAGNTRKEIETTSGKKVVTSKNYLGLKKVKKISKNKELE